MKSYIYRVMDGQATILLSSLSHDFSLLFPRLGEIVAANSAVEALETYEKFLRHEIFRKDFEFCGRVLYCLVSD